MHNIYIKVGPRVMVSIITSKAWEAHLMVNSIPVIILLGILWGVLIGIGWPNINTVVFEITYKKLQGHLAEGLVFLVASLIGWFCAFCVILSMLIFAPIIPDDLWVYFYKSYFIAMFAGVFILVWYKKSRVR